MAANVDRHATIATSFAAELHHLPRCRVEFVPQAASWRSANMSMVLKKAHGARGRRFIGVLDSDWDARTRRVDWSARDRRIIQTKLLATVIVKVDDCKVLIFKSYFLADSQKPSTLNG